MNRRNFVTILGSVAGGAVLIPTGLYFASPKLKKYAEKLIFTELSYLKLDPKGVTTFVDDYFKAYDNSFFSAIKWKTYYYLNTGTHQSDNLFQLVRAYLLSSDFFLNKTDTEKTVKYLGMFNPYKSQVPNPYSYILYKHKIS